MGYTYFKPKTAEELINFLESKKQKTYWSIAIPGNLVESQRYFDAYHPILVILKDGKVVGAAHNKLEKGPIVIGVDDIDKTHEYSKHQLREIDVFLKQLELF